MSSAESEMYYPFEAPQIVVAGGGGGTSVMAAGLAESLPYASVTALVCMSDGGGSTGLLRDQFATPPVGDIRKCTSALCPDQTTADIFERRLSADDDLENVAFVGQSLLTALDARGLVRTDRSEHIMHATTELAAQLPKLQGHTFGNLVLTSLTIEHNDVGLAAREAGELLAINGRVVPVTKDPHHLMMYDGEHVIVGEDTIDTHTVTNSEEAYVWLSPSAAISDEARNAVENADALLVGPGSVFTSLLPVLAVRGMQDALKSMRGQMIAVANLVTQGHETDGWDVADYLRKLETYTQRAFDYVVYNTVHDTLPDTERPVIFNSSRVDEYAGGIVAIGTDLTNAHEVRIDPNDKLAALRSRVHHNPQAIARVLNERILSGQAI